MSVLYVFDCPHGKRLNFLHQCEMCAKEHLASRAETIRTQQSTIDRLLSSLKLNVPNCEAAFCNAKATYEYHDYEGTFCKCEKHKSSLYEINDDWNDAVKLIAEIEAGK